MSAFELVLSDDERFLDVRFERPQRTLSWAIHGGGFGVFRRVVWHFVRREELTPEVDARELFVARLAARGSLDAVGLLTARKLGPYGLARAEHHGVTGTALVTVGLGNALRAGDPPVAYGPIGTINTLAHVSCPLSDEALIEALALASEARTLALLEFGFPSTVSGLPATGTGTDCIVVAAPFDDVRGPYAGKHTAAGAAIGESVLAATRHATQRWLAENRP